ncbi:MAG TPA: benzoate-CoA ligase family protein [Anaerolineae bacterium]|nr:benzoate-CoA ligase family protein [Anaerolineae bacterium]
MKAADLPLYYNAVDILERNLAQRADKLAVYSDTREPMTFREVSNEVNRVGNALKKLDVRMGETVAILSLDCPEWVSSFFGIFKIGGIAAGINTLLTPGEIDYILNDCRARVLIVHEKLLATFDQIRDKQEHVKHVVVIGQPSRPGDIAFRDWIAAESTGLQAAKTHRDDFCSLNYSSGTTGEPKGVLHAHKDHPLTSQLWGVNVLGLREDDRTLAGAKLFFTFGLGGNLIFPWYAGASIVLFSGPPRIPTNMLEMVQRFKPTILYNAPTGFAATLAVEGFTQKYDLSSLRLCVSAGESLPAPIWHAWKEATGLDIIDGIGSTENFHIFLSNRPGDIRPGSSGKPFEGYELKIVDENGNEMPHGEVGNLLVKGETATPFYLHQYGKSQKTFLGEWLFTGDKYTIDEDGYYWHAGRSDDMLKVGGIWVSPVEVESTLISHPAVLECAVVGQADSSNLIKPKAYVILNPGYEPSDALANELTEHCKQKMAEYKRPRWIEFVPELPKTATGKIQRFRLRG